MRVGLLLSAVLGLGLVCGAQAPKASVADRSAALSALFKEMWEDGLKHSPEFASSLGDRRYNDQLSDLSPRAVADGLARSRGYLTRLTAIDTTGLSDQEKLSVSLMERELIEEQEGARYKEWEMPVNQFHGIHTDLPSEIVDWPFATVKDYDDYIARLQLVPRQLRQASENLQAGIDDGRTQPAYLMAKVEKQTEDLAGNTPAQSPFATPLKKMPATFSDADKKRLTAGVLGAIQDDVLPAYVRFAKFMRVVVVPAGRKEPGVWAAKEGDAYYAYCVRRSTTLDKTPAEIHQIGLDEVKRDEAEMLAIVQKLGYTDVKSFGGRDGGGPEAACGIGGRAAGPVPRARGGNETEAAGAVWASAEGAARGGGDAGLPGQGPGGGVVRAGCAGWGRLRWASPAG